MASSSAPPMPQAQGGQTPFYGVTVQLMEWKGPARDSTYVSVSLNTFHEVCPKGNLSNIGLTWGQNEVRLQLTPESDPMKHVLEFSVIEGGALGDTCVGKFISEVGSFSALSTPGLHQFQPVLTNGNGEMVGTLFLRMSLVLPPNPPPPAGSTAPFAPTAPTAPPATNPTALPVNPYAQSLPIMSGPLPPSAPPMPGAPAPGARCTIVRNEGGPLRYTGPPPMPMPPTQDATPKQIWQQHVNDTTAKRQVEEQEYRQKRATEPKKKGFFAQLEQGLNSAVHHTTNFVKDAAMSTEIALRKSDEEGQERLWRSVFPNLSQDRLVASYKCRFTNGAERGVEGVAFVSTGHFAFVANNRMDGQQPPFFEQLRNVVTYQLAQSFSVPCIQIYSASGYVYQFSHFPSDFKRQVGTYWGTVHGTAFQGFCIYFDTEWRKNTPVPIPGFQYM